MVKRQITVAADPSAHKGGKKLSVKKDKMARRVASPATSAQKQAARLRTWEYAASRCIRLKLGAFPASQVANNKDKDGRNIEVKVIEALMKLRPLKKHLSVDFWATVIKDHQLRGGWASDLPPPTEEETVDKELNASLAQCHCSNPALKSPAKILRWMAYANLVNRTEFCGLLAGSAEGPSLSSSMSLTILHGSLKYVARVKAHEAYPDLWKIASNHFDMLLVRQWQRSQSKGTTRCQFLRTWRNELSLFVSTANAC